MKFKNINGPIKLLKFNFSVEPFLYLSPALLIILFVFLIPIGFLFRISFYEVNTLIGQLNKFVGIENYLGLFDYKLGAIIWNTIVYVGFSTPLILLIGFFVALLLNQDIPGKKILWLLSFIPWVVPIAISTVLWRFLVHSQYGLLNYILLKIKIIHEPISFLSFDSAMLTCICVRVWKGIPFAFVMFLSGIQGIPKEMYEAARIDGALPWQCMFFITLPQLRPIITMTGLIMGIWTFREFDEIWVLTQGGPGNVTETLPIAIFRLAFQQMDSGRSAALAFIGVIILSILVIIYSAIIGEKK